MAPEKEPDEKVLKILKEVVDGGNKEKIKKDVTELTSEQRLLLLVGMISLPPGVLSNINKEETKPQQ